MRCGWFPEMSAWCGKVGKVTEIDEQSVELTFVGGVKLWWDTELFDASLTRYCHIGCVLQRMVVATPRVCGVCRWYLPMGGEASQCDEHDCDICLHCLGHSRLPPVRAKVIRGPTWPEESLSPSDRSEEGIVETELLEMGSSSHSIAANEDGEESMDVQGTGYHSYFKVHWIESGEVSYCRGPPFQDVTIACDHDLAVVLMQARATCPTCLSECGCCNRRSVPESVQLQVRRLVLMVWA